MNKLIEALEKIEDILVEVSANLVNKSKEQELVHKAFLISKKAVKEHAANKDNTYKSFEDLIIHALEHDLHGCILDRAKDALTHPNHQP